MVGIFLSGGTVGIGLHVVSHTYNTNKKIRAITIPGSTKNEYQDMGSQGKEIRVTGWTFVNADTDQFATWEDASTSLCYSGTKAYVSGCILTGLSYKEDQSPNTAPVNYRFTLKEI